MLNNITDRTAAKPLLATALLVLGSLALAGCDSPTQKNAENQADAMENQAHAVRAQGEATADALEERADTLDPKLDGVDSPAEQRVENAADAVANPPRRRRMPSRTRPTRCATRRSNRTFDSQGPSGRGQGVCRDAGALPSRRVRLRGDPMRYFGARFVHQGPTTKGGAMAASSKPGVCMRSRLLSLSTIILLAGLTATPALAQQTGCDRSCLVKFVDAYYSALTANNPAALPQAATARVTNGLETKLGNTFWDGAEQVTWRFDIVNTRRGDTGTQVVIRNADGSKTMQMLRLKVRGRRHRRWRSSARTRAMPTGSGARTS